MTGTTVWIALTKIGSGPPNDSPYFGNAYAIT